MFDNFFFIFVTLILMIWRQEEEQQEQSFFFDFWAELAVKNDKKLKKFSKKSLS